MIAREIITPQDQTIKLNIPESFIGRQIEVLIFPLDESDAKTTAVNKKQSDFRGKMKLTDEQYADLTESIKR